MARGAPEALELLLKEAEGRGVAVEEIVEGDCAGLISAALEQGIFPVWEILSPGLYLQDSISRIQFAGFYLHH